MIFYTNFNLYNSPERYFLRMQTASKQKTHTLRGTVDKIIAAKFQGLAFRDDLFIIEKSRHLL